MNTLWIKIGCLLTGWNPKILESCTESSRKQLKKYTSALIILIILWGLIGFLFADRYIRSPWWGSMITGIIMVIVVIQIERQIILTVGKLKWLSLFRGLIAIIMAIIGSAIIDQIIFKEDIEKKMVEIVDRQVTEQLPGRLTVINSKLNELQTEVDSLNKKNLEIYAEIAKRPTINTISTSTTHIPVTQEDGSIKTVPQRTISSTPIENPKIKEAEINNQHLEVLRKQQEEYTLRKMDAESSLRNELKSKTGFLGELNAIIEIITESTYALIFYIILFAFLMALELFVVLSKAGERCDYDLVVEYQLEQKKKSLIELMRQDK